LRSLKAVSPPIGTAAASSNVIREGLSAISSLAGRHRYSAYAPNLNPHEANTSSPGLNRVTFLPTTSTTPDNSNPRMLTRVGLTRPLYSLTRNGFALRIRQSPAVAVVA